MPPTDLLAQAAPAIARPRVRREVPLLWRGPGVLQVGLDDGSVTVHGIGADVVAWASRIDGTRTWPQVREALTQSGVHPQAARRLLAALVAAGALDDAAAMPDHWRWIGVDERLEALGDLAAAALCLRDPHAANTTLDRRHAVAVDVDGEGALADAVRASLAASGLALAVEPDRASIRVLARPGHPDVLDDLAVEDYDRPHLVVAAHGPLGLVGPLVVPGSTSCLRCRHLHRLDADPAWATLTLQASSSARHVPVPPVDRLLARLVADHAALLVRQWADDPQDHAHWADQAIEIRLPDGQPRIQARPPHPCCGCTWPAD